jgi:hypothetical protein
MGTVSRIAGIFAYGVVVVAFWDNHVFDLASTRTAILHTISKGNALWFLVGGDLSSFLYFFCFFHSL